MNYFEAGIGTEYGGIGTQVKIPIGKKNFELYGAVGLFGVDSTTGEEIGAGVGINYFLNKHNSISIYTGVLHINKYTTETLEFETESDAGVSFGYKFYFNGAEKQGFGLGVSYNIYDGGKYPFFSIGYRF